MQQLKATKLGPWWKFWRKYKYHLDEIYIYQSEILGYYISFDYLVLFPDGIIYFKRGYLWNGASGPTWDTLSCRRCTLVHDGFYDFMCNGGLPHSYKEYADQLLKSIGIEDGMDEWRAWYWYQGVKHFGHFALRKG